MQPIAQAMIADIAATEHHGAAFGMNNLIGEIGAVLSPAVSGALRDATGGWSTAIFLDAALIGGAVILFLFVRDTRHGERPPLPLALAYFFELPNVGFGFYPVFDFRTFRDGYRADDRGLWQTGVAWIVHPQPETTAPASATTSTTTLARTRTATSCPADYTPARTPPQAAAAPLFDGEGLIPD